MADYDLRACGRAVVERLCALHHGYGGAGRWGVYTFAVYEHGVPVAAFAWQPASLGTSRQVCPEAPQGVLALSRMVAVPREERALSHISRPLRRQMKHLIDRTRWPVLVTYHDERQGHTGHVYKCSGWERRGSAPRSFMVDAQGVRRGEHHRDAAALVRGGTTTLHRWEHWACERGAAAAWMEGHGWVREPIPGKVWRSGNPAYRLVRREVPRG